MDVIAMHQAGFTNAVASLGTALTSGHASLVKRYTKEVLLLYDSDGAGIRAALRAIPILKGGRDYVQGINMKPWKDPDEFIKNEGAEAFEERLNRTGMRTALCFVYILRNRNLPWMHPDRKTEFLSGNGEKDALSLKKR